METVAGRKFVMGYSKDIVRYGKTDVYKRQIQGRLILPVLTGQFVTETEDVYAQS